MDVIIELLMLIDLFMNASLTTQILASIFLLPPVRRKAPSFRSGI